MAPNSTFLANLQKLKNNGLASNQNPYAPSGATDPQPTDGHIETPVDQGIHVDDPYAPQRDPQPTDGMAANSPYAPQKVGKGHQILGELLGAVTNPQIAKSVTGYTSPGLQKEEQGLELQRAQTELTRQQGSMVTLPNGTMMPMSLAKAYLPVKAREEGAANVANINVGGRENVAQTGAAARTGAAQIGANARVEVGKMNLGPMADVPQDLQDQFGLPSQLPLTQLNRAETAAGKPLTVVQGASGPSEINKFASAPAPGQSSRSLGLGAPAMGRAVQVGDPNNPGNTVYETAGQAVHSGAAGPTSASVQVPKQAEKAEVPTNIGNQKVAFNTAIQHAQLLKQAYQALHNGDTPTLNSIKNAFSSAFGGAGPITYDAIANAYNHEVTSVTSKGHLTNQEVTTGGATMPANASPAQFGGVIDAYQKLMQSKMNMLNQQEQGAVRGSQPHGSTQGNDPLGIR